MDAMPAMRLWQVEVQYHGEGNERQIQQYWQPSLALIPQICPGSLRLRFAWTMQLVLFIGLALTVQVLRGASKVEKKSQTSVDTLE